MKSAHVISHVISNEKEVLNTIKKSFPEEVQIKSSKTIIEALESLQKIRIDMLFVDMEILKKASEASNIKTVLLSFWSFYPSLEIIVMTSQEMLREAVQTVKDGASNYLTYPLITDEVKLVSQNIINQRSVQSELDYLRDQF